MKNWYKLENFDRPGPDGPDAPTTHPKIPSSPPYLPGYALPPAKIYALAKKQYLGTFIRAPTTF